MPVLALSGFFNSLAQFDIRTILIRVLIVCISLSVHEWAHAWAAYKLGDDTAALQGRLSLNPLVHLDPVGAIAFLVGGIGWAKPVPINATRFDRKHSMKKGIVLTSLAGPLSNLVLAVLSAIVYFLLITLAVAARISADNVFISTLLLIFSALYFSNVVLAVFNLLPVPPLDGYKVFGAALPGSIYYKIMEYERYIGIAFLFLIFFGRGILGVILQTISWPFNQVIWRPLELLFRWIWSIAGLV